MSMVVKGGNVLNLWKQALVDLLNIGARQRPRLCGGFGRKTARAGDDQYRKKNPLHEHWLLGTTNFGSSNFLVSYCRIATISQPDFPATPRRLSECGRRPLADLPLMTRKRSAQNVGPTSRTRLQGSRPRTHLPAGCGRFLPRWHPFREYRPRHRKHPRELRSGDAVLHSDRE